jgi:hypothetical protein
MMTTDELSEYLVGAAKLWLSDPTDDFMPVMTIERANVERLDLVGLAVNGHPYSAVVAYRQAAGDDVVRVSLSTDSYQLIHPDDDRSPVGHGDLHEMFMSGHPDVSEAIMIAIVAPESERTIILPYRRTETAIVWSEPTTSTEVEGRMVEALRTYL